MPRIAPSFSARCTQPRECTSAIGRAARAGAIVRPIFPRERSPMRWTWFHRLASPPTAYSLARRLRPWLLWPAIALMLWSAFEGLFVTPPDFQQGEGYPIIYVHVPTAALSTVAYCVMAT